jgi:Ser-tRNA(Ala) deacylase AlaX
MEIKGFVEGLPKTECLYLKDSFLEFDGQVLKITREGKKIYLALDKTAFQPQGGAQPTDIGKIKGERLSLVLGCPQ